MTEAQHNFQVFPWNDNFLTGVARIDEQHQVLVSLLNDLASQLVSEDAIELSNVFDQLAAYAQHHFETEEGIWAPYFKDDPWFIEHQKTHASFLPKTLEIKAREGGNDLNDACESIIKFLIRWLAFHIIDSDQRMAIVIRKVDAGVSLDDAKDIADKEMRGSHQLLVDTVLSMYDSLSSRTLDLMRERIERQRTEKKLLEALQKLEEIATKDKLTGLRNRRNFDEVVERELGRKKREKKLFSLIIFDIDFFKKLNDNYGHAQGDEALRIIGHEIQALCRRPGDFPFRIGGEEFCVVIDSESKQHTQEFAELIRLSIENLNILHAYSEVSDYVTVSVGVVSKISDADSTVEEFFKKADSRLYKAKKKGRNRVVSKG